MKKEIKKKKNEDEGQILIQMLKLMRIFKVYHQ